MRSRVPILALLLAGGCAARPGSPSPPLPSVDPELAESPRSDALVFSPTGVPNGAYLPRDERQRGAFVSFDELNTSLYYVRTTDRQTNDWTDRYERKAVIERTGVSFR